MHNRINVYNQPTAEINAITHTPPHHADEVFATAMLAMVSNVELLRTRNPKLIEDNPDAIVYDVGGKYDPESKRFDHHQRDFAETRPDGTPYSSAGLIWREYGSDIVKKLGEDQQISDDEEIVAKTVEHVDNDLIKDIDARDNGHAGTVEGASISSIIGNYNTRWDVDEDPNEEFLKACELAGNILERETLIAISRYRGRKIVADRIKQTSGKVLVLDRFVGGWVQEVLDSGEDNADGLLYGVFPARDGNWNIQALPPSKDEMTKQRKPFPTAWRGLNGQELSETSGVDNAVFCHKGGFFAVAKTKEDALKMANLSAEAEAEDE